MAAVIIPYKQLSPQALAGVVEEFVTRDGTDYGDNEICLETKILKVMRELENQTAVIVFDDITQTCNVLSKNDPAVKALK